MSARDQRIRERAHGRWVAEGCVHGRDVEHWLLAEAEVPVRVTFDTNTIDKACRPERHPKDPDQPCYLKVNEALKDGRLQGFICDTSMSLEAVQKIHRAETFGSTRLKRQPAPATVASDGVTTVPLNLQVEQPARPALHPENVKRLKAALDVGCRVIGAPRIGMPKIDDPDKNIYLYHDNEEALGRRLDKFFEALRAIEDRGYGTAPVKRIAATIANRGGVREPWFKSLDRATAQETPLVAKAIAEWADGDMIAAHVGYQNDVLCTGDKGVSAGDSILNHANRIWLSATYGVRLMTIVELAAGL